MNFIAFPRSSSRRPTSWSMTYAGFDNPGQRRGAGRSGRADRAQLARREHAVHAAHEPVLVEVEPDRAARRIAGLDAPEVDDQPRDAIQHPDADARGERTQLAQPAVEMRHSFAAHHRLARGVELAAAVAQRYDAGSQRRLDGARVAAGERIHEARDRLAR